MDHICVNCGSDKTYLQKGKWPDWRKHDGKWYCSKCNNNLFTNPKWHKINSVNRLRFKGKSIYLGFNPKTGVCSVCRKQGKTHMHHIKYHDDDPLRDTIELCVSCHNRTRLCQENQ